MIKRKSKVTVFKFFEHDDKIEFLMQLKQIQNIKVTTPASFLFVEVETDDEELIGKVREISSNYSLRK